MQSLKDILGGILLVLMVIPGTIIHKIFGKKFFPNLPDLQGFEDIE